MATHLSTWTPTRTVACACGLDLATLRCPCGAEHPDAAMVTIGVDFAKPGSESNIRITATSYGGTVTVTQAEIDATTAGWRARLLTADDEIVRLADQRDEQERTVPRIPGMPRMGVAWRGTPILERTIEAARARLAAKPPPTDAEIVAAWYRCQRQEGGHGSSRDAAGKLLSIFVGSKATGRDVTVRECMAAASRVLAARCAASDEQRRRDAMVYGPIDDADV